MRKLAGILVLVLGSIALLGADGGTYQGGTYGSRGASYQAGGAPAGWDTFVIVLSTQDIAGAAGDTFALPSSPQGTASPPTLDYARVYEINDYILGRGAKSWRDDNGDAATVYRLGTTGSDGDIPSFAYSEIDTLRPDGYGVKVASSNVASAFYGLSSNLVFGGAVRVLNMASSTYIAADSSANGRSRFQLVYVPFEDIFPQGATIVDAKILVSSSGNRYWTTSDSVVATLMDNPNDNKWYTQKGVAYHADWAEASWRQQHSAAWGGTAAHPWNPELKLRARPWDWGKVSDWSGSTLTGGAAFAQYQKMEFNITNCVQAAILPGAVNNGIKLQYFEYSTSSGSIGHYNWDRLSSATVNWRTPVIVIKYITKKYQPLFGTSDLAFVFTTDDWSLNANEAFTDTFNAHGGKYTIFGARVQHGAPRAGISSLLGWLGEGHEIGTHSRSHLNPGGLTAYEKARPGKVWDATARAEVYADAKPDWLYALADSAIGDSLKSHPYFGKSMALPLNEHSMGVQRVLADLGFVSARASAVGTVDRTKWPVPPTWAPAYGDTGMSVASHAQRRPRNMMLLPYSLTVSNIVGDTTQHDITMDEVRGNLRRALFQWRGQGRGEFVMLTHDLKSGPLKTGFYSDGIDADELGAMLDVVDEFGARYMTASEIGRWKRAGSTPIDTPTGFFNAVTDDDSARYYAADRVWYKPHGVDNRWIRGVK